MSSAALSFIDLSTLMWLNTVLLDDPDQGAANPWAILWSPDGRQIFVTHAGTHEVSILDAPALMAHIRDVLTGANRQNQHGTTSHLSASELVDLEAFVLSL